MAAVYEVEAFMPQLCEENESYNIDYKHFEIFFKCCDRDSSCPRGGYYLVCGVHTLNGVTFKVWLVCAS